MNGVCNGTFFFGPAPWGPDKGPKGQISLNIIKFQLQSHIRQDFHSVAWVMPQGSDLGVPWGVWRSNFFFEIQPDLVCELLT